MIESSFQFTNPSMVSMVFEENTGFKIKKGQEIEIQTELNIENTKLSEDEAIVEIKIKLGKKGEGAPFFLETVFMASFKWERNMEANRVEVLLSQNAPALLLSYARPIVSMITNASHYPAYNIPFVNFTKSMEQK